MGATNTAELAAMVRSIIERQVATTQAGKALTEYDPGLVASLVSNVARNVTAAVVLEVSNILEANGVEVSL